MIFSSETEIKIDKGYCAAEDGQLIAVDLSILRDKVNVIRVLSACQVINADGPGVVSLLMDLVIAIDVHIEIDAEIIGDAVGIPVAVINTFGAIVIVFGNRQRDWPASAINHV